MDSGAIHLIGNRVTDAAKKLAHCIIVKIVKAMVFPNKLINLCICFKYSFIFLLTRRHNRLWFNCVDPLI